MGAARNVSEETLLQNQTPSVGRDCSTTSALASASFSSVAFLDAASFSESWKSMTTRKEESCSKAASWRPTSAALPISPTSTLDTSAGSIAGLSSIGAHSPSTDIEGLAWTNKADFPILPELRQGNILPTAASVDGRPSQMHVAGRLLDRDAHYVDMSGAYIKK